MFKELDFDSLRQGMVDRQLIPRGIKDQKVIDAFQNIPRHRFIPEDYQKSAYGDFPLPIGEDQTISQPYIVALMTQALAIKNSDKILEIGTGSGYQAAVLASLAKTVYSVERIELLAQEAQRRLKELEYNNITIKVGDGTLGLEEFAPYDKMMVTAAAPSLPQSLTAQLNNHGKIVIPISAGFSQVLTLFTKEEDRLEREDICGCVFVPLIGKYGYRK